MTEPQGRQYGRRSLVNASDVVLYMQKAYKVRLSPATIRSWAARRRIATYGNRRERYDLKEVEDYALKKGVIRKRGSENDGTGD